MQPLYICIFQYFSIIDIALIVLRLSTFTWPFQLSGYTKVGTNAPMKYLSPIDIMIMCKPGWRLPICNFFTQYEQNIFLDIFSPHASCMGMSFVWPPQLLISVSVESLHWSPYPFRGESVSLWSRGDRFRARGAAGRWHTGRCVVRLWRRGRGDRRGRLLNPLQLGG